MYLLDPTYIRDSVDYSFGDQSGQYLVYGYMKNANINNEEFKQKYDSIKRSKNVMTLFIDNIRLYEREGVKYTSIENMSQYHKDFKDKVVKEYYQNNDLLKLCHHYDDMNFIIFTGFEDTPIDEFIFDKIPENVLAIYASNSTTFGGKVKPIPYGIQRKLSPNDNRHQVLVDMINYSEHIQPNKLLYINHSDHNGFLTDRVKVKEKFADKSWATVSSPKSIEETDYRNYLLEIKNHKFMICPDGNAIGCECHRDWEVLYMKRVPIVKDTPYLREIFKDFPVLFVNDFLEVDEDLLKNNDHLYSEVQSLDMSKLDIETLYKKLLEQVSC